MRTESCWGAEAAARCRQPMYLSFARMGLGTVGVYKHDAERKLHQNQNASTAAAVQQQYYAAVGTVCIGSRKTICSTNNRLVLLPTMPTWYTWNPTRSVFALNPCRCYLPPRVMQQGALGCVPSWGLKLTSHAALSWQQALQQRTG